MKPVLLLATNIILRFLCQDDPAQSCACTDLFTRAERGEFSLHLDAISVAEAVWVLTSVYHHPRAKVEAMLSSLLQHPSVIAENRDRLQNALLLFGSTNADFIDCHFAAQGQETGRTIVTYDRGFKKFPGIIWRTPERV